MKIRLLNKSNTYQLCYIFEKIEFNIQDISFLKIQKKYCYFSIICILFFSVAASSMICNYCSLSQFFLFLYFLIICISLVILFYNHTYTIDIKIHSERFSFETKDIDLVNDFFMLHYFYSDAKDNILKSC